MTQAYSDPSRESDPHALPNIEVFQLTAREIAESPEYEDIAIEFSRTYEHRLAFMNSRARDKMFDAMIEQEGITGGWFWQACFPGCLPDSDPVGPFKSYDEALKDAQDY